MLGNTPNTYAGNLDLYCQSSAYVDLVRKHQLHYNRLHTLLHLQFKRDGATKTPGQDAKTQSLSAKLGESPESHSSHLFSPNPGGHNSTLLMTLQVVVVAPDGHVTRAKALLDCASATSFVTEHTAQWLQLHNNASVFKLWHWW